MGQGGEVRGRQSGLRQGKAPTFHKSRSAKSRVFGLADEVTQYRADVASCIRQREDAERVIVECTFINPRHFQ
jgi:hypothetical protein